MADMNVSLLIEFLTKGGDKVRRDLAGIRSGAKDLREGLAGAIRQGFSVENIERATRDAERKLNEARGRLRGAMGSAIALAAPVWTAGNFEAGMADVATLIDTAAESLEEMGSRVLQIADRTPVTLDDLTAALYDVRSAGIEAADAMSVLEGSARLGVAGKGTTKEAADLVTSSINAFDLKGEKQARIYDTIFKAVKNGKTTISELSQGFGAVAGTVANAGVEIDEYLASIAAMTTTGMPAAQAHTQIRAAISGLTRETKDSRKLFKKLGADNFRDLVEKSGGMVPAFDRIRQALGGNDAAILKVLGSVEALNAVLGLTGEQASVFQETLTDMRDGANAVDEAFEKLADPFKNQLRVMRNQLQGLAIAVGTHLIKPLKSVIATIRPLVVAIADWMQANPELTSSIVQGVAALLAMNVAMRLVSYAVAAARLPLIGLAKSFLLFDAAGRNVSIVARAVRALAGAGAGLGRAATSAALFLASFGPRRIKSALAGLAKLSTFMKGGVIATAFAGLKTAATAALSAIAAAGWPVTAVLAAIAAAAFAVWKYWDRLKAAVGGVFEGLTAAFAPELDFVKQAWSDLVDNVAARAGEIATRLGVNVDAVRDTLARMVDVSGALAGLRNGLGQAKDVVTDFLASVFTAETLSEAEAEEIAAAARRIGERIGHAIRDTLRAFTGFGTAIVDAIIDGLDSAWGTLTEWFEAKVAALKGLLSFGFTFGGGGAELPGNLPEIGRNNGFTDAPSKSPFPSSAQDPIQPLESYANDRKLTGAKVEQEIKAEVVDRRPPQVTVHVSQSITGVSDPVAAAAAANRGITDAVRRAKTGAMHGGTE
ncbi:phage tail tape measure protein [Polymorphum gilvum]|uniref:Phage tail tape measure protein, TP901 family, core region n=1 Tax=Polymorphum gilvum (strain LMG 25793 / CGMCC 1.9160 / SL003B-26A1) TaxID=991905 RepID=F2J629_POLGS|nr:phage tail tape measure protein [Polymorphum gilvum]ADZ72393.1 Phage tail tape measure protein, TP901 family, core region [Polymorphum gilvum SL003B-26A1]